MILACGWHLKKEVPLVNVANFYETMLVDHKESFIKAPKVILCTMTKSQQSFHFGVLT